ncbi:MAG: SDR family oxidoreductase [Deltaproteobacteria bacterium]|jgi:NAD(P)-dependent dehydrogenase (short-subunit alcohol dehydrogenase family)|nr:SDR family oxidoreductase [Deltaproteobacteria bacterium]MBT4087443.1 SDR family oxidoreductase [Deltaproteobacteria bacterium]MBT4269025.1 SDR family oxidoreductase [Deltaproteobacteria bacterium]MBT4638880.1 SDR family oxidoreductase [Deltaproteobacteria bacterium]MBT6502430.1 SDR family oxidoreductase [Deltaproteobacteria bacterium]
MKNFKEKIAVITGAGTGIGRNLASQLAAEGCHVAICDVLTENLNTTIQICNDIAPAGTLITAHTCDVSDETQVIAFCEAVKQQHQTEHINLLFNNAGIGGGPSFLLSDRDEWERTFGVDWFGVYYCARAFMPLLVASSEGHLINTSSVNGFWACLGPHTAHTAYCTAKFAVKGFSEALLVDLRMNAPHVKVSVVMPGHIGTEIIANTNKILGAPKPADMTAEDLMPFRQWLEKQQISTENISDDELRAMIELNNDNFTNNAPLSAAQAATIILDGVRDEKWRILVGDDAHALDQQVRDDPETAYELSFIEKMLSFLPST